MEVGRLHDPTKVPQTGPLASLGEAFFFGDRQFKLTLDRSEKFQISKLFQWSCMRVEEECPGTSRNECGRARNYSEQLLHVVRVLFWNVNRTEFAQERMYNQWRTCFGRRIKYREPNVKRNT